MEMLLERCRKGDNKAMMELSEKCNGEMANMWLVRAVLYGNEEARQELKINPERAANTLINIKNFIPGERNRWFSGHYSAATLMSIGFDNLPNMNERYTMAGLSKERVLVLGIETDYEPPDEYGYGAEIYYDFYAYDEFFNRISKEPIKGTIRVSGEAYQKGAEYIKNNSNLPGLRIDWLVEDGIINPDKMITMNF